MNERKLNTILDSERLAVVYPISIGFILPTSLSNELWILSKVILQFTLKHTLATNHAAQEQLNIILQTAWYFSSKNLILVSAHLYVCSELVHFSHKPKYFVIIHLIVQVQFNIMGKFNHKQTGYFCCCTCHFVQLRNILIQYLVGIHGSTQIRVICVLENKGRLMYSGGS